MRAVPIFLSEQVAARVVVLPDGHDPDTFLAQEGAGAFAHLLDGAQALSEFVFSQLVQKYGQHLEGKAKIAAELRPLIEATADHSSQRKLFIAHFAEKLGLQPEDLTTAGGPAAGLLPRAGKRREGPIRTSDEGGVEATAAVLPKREEQILTFLLLHPEQVASFSEAGLGEILTSPSARTLHETLVRMASDGEATIDIDLVLPRLTPPEQRLVSRLLVLAAPESGEASEREADAQEKIAWIRRQRRLKRLHELTREIHAAQLGNNQRAILDLLAEKRALSVQDEGG
jgi:DNA primase